MLGRRLPLTLLATGLVAGAMTVPADAAITLIGPDLESAPAATTALSDPNDVLYWSADGPAGIEVPVQGEIRGIRLKGGTEQTPEQTAAAEAFDPKYDILHWVVLRPQGDGTWRSVATSEDVVAPVIGRNGVTESTITEIRQPQDQYRICAKPGDRVALGTVGGYVPTRSPAGAPIPGFERGLPYKVFHRGNDFTTNEFLANGEVTQNETVVTAKPARGIQLLMQAIVGSGPDARYTCQTAAEQQGGGGGGTTGGGGGGGTTTPAAPLRPMATPLLKSRRLDKKGVVPINLSCRKEGTTCSGMITLRAHKKTIGKKKYTLAAGASGVFKIKLTKAGRRFVKVASKGYLRTAVVVTSTGGRKGSGIFNIRPRKR